ncbi:MAG: gluconate 2-dehydrogenase subunit 3 family protein [Bryobacteraceae bacterium]
MKRRNFFRSALTATVLPAVVLAEQTPTQQPPPAATTPARERPRQPQSAPHLAVTEVDVTAETSPHFFTADQLATLTKLATILVPPMKGKPGAVDAQAPEFLDFLLSVSPKDRQLSYQHGLDTLNAEAKKTFGSPFAAIDPKQADKLIRPLLVARPWPQDLPKDPMKSFLAQVHEDLRTATTNSREYAAAASTTGGRFTRGGSGLYWAPIDPIS